MSFKLEDFVIQSNLIDPQYDLKGIWIRGDSPKTIMYQRQMAAWETMTDIFTPGVKKISPSFDCYIHRELTRGIDAFEHYNMSGRHRIGDVWFDKPDGSREYLPKAILIDDLIADLIWNMELALSDPGCGEEEATRRVNWIHDFFECIHPFADGNGRTGRLIMNGMRIALGVEPIVVWYKERQAYYNRIRAFSSKQFAEWMQMRAEQFAPEQFGVIV